MTPAQPPKRMFRPAIALAAVIAAGCAVLPVQAPRNEQVLGGSGTSRPVPPDQPWPSPAASQLTPPPSAAPTATPDAGSPLVKLSLPPGATPAPAATPSDGAVTVATPTTTATPTATPDEPGLPSPLPRATADRPDDDAGYQVHVIYAVPSDGEDRGLDTDGTLMRSVEAFDAWLLDQTGGKQRLRMDRAGGALDITYVKLAGTDAALKANGLQLRDALEREVKALGFSHAKKMYAVYYDGSSQTVCGGGPWPPSLPGTVAAMYLKGQPRCDEAGWTPDGRTMTYREYAMLHELLHGFGFMPTCAPHQTRSGHTSYSPNDLMYAGDKTWLPTVLDAETELYDHKTAGCLDLAKSAFLTPSRDGAEPPPSWSGSVGR